MFPWGFQYVQLMRFCIRLFEGWIDCFLSLFGQMLYHQKFQHLAGKPILKGCRQEIICCLEGLLWRIIILHVIYVIMAMNQCSHVLFSCSVSHSIWQQFLNWLGVYTALHAECRANFSQFVGILYGKLPKMVLTEWFAIIWSIWSCHNDITFRNGNSCIASILEKS